MRSKTPLRKHKVAWPDRHRWADEFNTRLHADKTARVAYESLVQGGCLWGNLMSFLYAYTFSPEMVFQEHSRVRDEALEGLNAVAGRLDRTAVAMQRTLDLEWWKEPSFASFLQERCRFDFQAFSETGPVISGKIAPNFALHLPSVLSLIFV
jgi:hypothetical protein